MVEGLVDLGLLDGDVDELIASETYKKFCVHKSSHWLGLDVHDVGDYRVDDAWRTLEPGMVMTVEPGIYLPDDDSVPAAFRGIGHPHRRRRAGHARRFRSADGGSAETHRRHRSGDARPAASVTTAR